MTLDDLDFLLLTCCAMTRRKMSEATLDDLARFVAEYPHWYMVCRSKS